MDLKSLATQLVMQKLGANQSSDNAMSALTDLLGAGESFDLGNVVSQLSGAGGGTASKLSSWLGDGNNESMSAEELESAIGADKLNEFASRMGVESQEAKNGLAELLPNLIDKGSQGGNLLSSEGIQGALGGLASSLFKK